jgi:hypothetical protein
LCQEILVAQFGGMEATLSWQRFPALAMKGLAFCFRVFRVFRG